MGQETISEQVLDSTVSRDAPEENPADPQTAVDTDKPDEEVDWEERFGVFGEKEKLSTVKSVRVSALASLAMARKRARVAETSSIKTPRDNKEQNQAVSGVLYVLDCKSTLRAPDGSPTFVANFYALSPFTNLEKNTTIAPSKTTEPDEEWEKLSNPVFEIVTEIYGHPRIMAPQIIDQNAGKNDATESRPPPPLASLQHPYVYGFNDIDIQRTGSSHMIIRSESLLKLLKSVVAYYPSQSLSGASVTIKEPYLFLLHHIDELRSRLVSPTDSNDAHNNPSSNFIPDSESILHTQVLVDFLEPFERKHLMPFRERLSRKTPVILFQDLLLLMRPGSDVYFEMSGKMVSGVLYSAKHLSAEEQLGKQPAAVKLGVWWLKYDEDDISKQKTSLTVVTFDGERAITSLPIYPSKIWDGEDGGIRRKQFEDRGKVLLNLSRHGPKQLFYSGKLHMTKSKRQYQGLIVATHNVDNIDDDEDPDMLDITLESYTDKEHEGSDSVNKFLDYESINYKTTPTLTDHMYFLTFPFIPGFGIKEKQWREFEVDCITDFPPRDSSLSYLVMEDQNRKVIQAISDLQSSTWRLDFIRGKGEGQIVLLHGPPGVGKTYTVECVAESTGRPLISLTIADIGLDEDNIETRLTKWFSLAEEWNGILLIDEADIFLERRRGADIARNSLVSVFLRKMEYFRGLLFLTTNRIGQIDDAFLSRVHVVIGYGRFTDEKRKEIWKGFFKKLAADMKQPSSDPSKPKVLIRINEYAKDYVLEDPAVLALKWNGREIRNALQTSITLAGYEAMKDENWTHEKTVTVKKEHFQDVVRMSGEFHKYMNDIDGRSESARARGRNERVE